MKFTLLIQLSLFLDISVAIAKRSHPFPFRTRKLSSSAPMVLHGRLCGRVGRRRLFYAKPQSEMTGAFFVLSGHKRGLPLCREVQAGLPLPALWQNSDNFLYDTFRVKRFGYEPCQPFFFEVVNCHMFTVACT